MVGKAVVGGGIATYPYPPELVGVLTGKKRGPSRVGQGPPTVIEIESDKLDFGVCELCGNWGCRVPSLICLSCQVKESCERTKVVYVKKHQLSQCRQRAREKPSENAGAYLVGWPCLAAPVVTFCSTQLNELRSLYCRVLMPTPPVDKTFQANFHAWYIDKWQKTLQLCPFTYRQWTQDDALAWTKDRTATERAQLLSAFADLERHLKNGTLIDACGGKEGEVVAFLKFEKDTGAGRDGPKSKCPRLIQGFEILMKVATAMVVDQVQKWFHTAAAVMFPGSRFSAGDNRDHLSAWFTDSQATLGEMGVNDLTSYDTTFSAACAELVIQLFKMMGVPDWFITLRERQISPIGRTRHGIVYLVEGTMRSGAADTCLSNTIVSLGAHHFSVVRHGGDHTRFRMAGMGDDTLLLKDPKLLLEHMEAMFYSLGFVPKLKWRVLDEDAIYLNMAPYPSSLGILFAPLIGRLLARLPWSTEPRNNWAAYTKAIAVAFVTPCSHVPILRKYFANLSNLQGSTKYHIYKDYKYSSFLNFDDLGNLKPLQSAQATTETYSFLLKRYGLAKADVDELENFIDNATRDGQPRGLSHPSLDVILGRDL